MKSSPSFLRSVASLFKKRVPSQSPAIDRPSARYIGIEALESRIAPALLMSVSGGTLKITGDAGDNAFTVEGDALIQTKFTLASAETINGVAAPFVAENVNNIVINLGDGNDGAAFFGVIPITLKGSLTFNGGDGANSIATIGMTIQKNVTITNGTNTTGSDNSTFEDANIGGNLTVKNGNGDTYVSISRGTLGNSTVGGNVSITNGTGTDNIYFGDTNFEKSITVKNGLANTTSNNPGFFNIYNTFNNIYNSTVLGSITVSYLNGQMAAFDGVWDTEVMKNVTFNYGETNANLHMDGREVTAPVVIHGNLSVKSKGSIYTDIGLQHKETGLIVGKNFTFQTGAGADTLDANLLTIRGSTKLMLGDGANTVTINDSNFYGALQMVGGTGVDVLNIETFDASDFATTFQKAAKFDLKAGADSVTFTGATDAKEAIVFWNKVSVLGSEVTSRNLTKEFSPFGYQIQVV